MSSNPTSRDFRQEAKPSKEESPVDIQSAESAAEEARRPSSRNSSHNSDVSSADAPKQQQQEQQQQQEPQPQPQQKPERKRTSPTSPSYVAPIPKIGPIPRVSPGPGIDPASSARLQLPEFVGTYLVGRRVDEYGDIVDDKTGRVLARAGGDLPSIVGRAVANTQGDILGDDGELLGYVADVGVEQAVEQAVEQPAGGDGGGGGGSGGQPPWYSQFPKAKSLLDVMRQSTMPLMIDPLGNILDTSGNVVGKFQDNNNPIHQKQREEQQRKRGGDAAAAAEEETTESREEPAKPSPSTTPQPGPEPEQKGEQPGPEKRENAQSWRKEDESPSDIFLDVKSTTEGIQLTIRIPTVFNGSQVMPKVQFS